MQHWTAVVLCNSFCYQRSFRAEWGSVEIAGVTALKEYRTMEHTMDPA
jgi:hypothetical protein